MGVHRIRSGSVGRPFTTGNPGGGRAPRGAEQGHPGNQGVRPGLCYVGYVPEDPQRRILAGRAPHMEVLLHHYAPAPPKTLAAKANPEYNGATGAADHRPVSSAPTPQSLGN
jgi:hypothetical protein